MSEPQRPDSGVADDTRLGDEPDFAHRLETCNPLGPGNPAIIGENFERSIIDKDAQAAGFVAYEGVGR